MVFAHNHRQLDILKAVIAEFFRKEATLFDVRLGNVAPMLPGAPSCNCFRVGRHRMARGTRSQGVSGNTAYAGYKTTVLTYLHSKLSVRHPPSRAAVVRPPQGAMHQEQIIEHVVTGVDA